MQYGPGVRQIAAERATRLPWLAPPAGYIVLIQDVAYGNRYKIARHQQLDQHQIKRGADFPFETRVALILEAENAAAAERDLQKELAAGATLGDWFDLAQLPKTPPAPSIAPAPTQPQESVSLLDLVENDEGADSLLREADIVATKGHVSTPRRSARQQPSRPRRRRSRVWRWAFALGLLLFVCVFAAERPGEIRRVIESMLNPVQQQSTSTGPEFEGGNQVFYTKARSQARSCAKLSCRVIAFLGPGNKITVRRYVSGQEIDGSTRWIEYIRRGELRYIHDSELSRTGPPFKPTESTTANNRSASPTPTVEGSGEVFFTNTYASVRLCAADTCQRDGLLSPGTRITARKYVKGQRVNGSTRWIAFIHNDKLRYIHDGELSRTWPVVEPTLSDSRNTSSYSASPTPKTHGRDEVFYTNTLARVRYCTNMSCRTNVILGSGSKITARRYVSGQQVNGSDRWIAFLHRGELRYIHESELSRTWPLVEPTPQPSPTAQPPRVKATAVGQGEVFYVRSIANARRCARLSCDVWDILLPGTKITALRFLQGQEIDSNDLWIRFSHNGRHLSIHSGKLSRTDPKAAALPTALYVVDRATVYKCVNTSCQAIDVLERGTKILPSGLWYGQRINDSNEWIRFRHNDHTVYIHSSYVTERELVNEPTADPSPTIKATSTITEPPPTATHAATDAPPTATATVTEPSPSATFTATESPPIATATVVAAAKYVVDTAGNANAHIRACPRTNCEIVAKFAPGTEIVVSGTVAGETVYGTDIWYEIKFEAGSAFIHSELAAEAG